MSNRRLDLWLPSYFRSTIPRILGKISRKYQRTHICFLVCDHFEPRHAIKREDQPQERLRIWRKEYSRLQERCQSAFGSRPKHTWFYPPHHGYDQLPNLSEMVFSGLGEVELHYHHDNDTSETLRRDLKIAIDEYHRWGLLLESGETPRTAFGFIHGDWALDNSNHGKHCGVNDELTILQQLGCWGDFTMPSANECQTRKINSIYYAIDDPQRAKSHDWGLDATVNKLGREGLFMMQGPLAINWRAPGYPRIENASLTTENWGRPDRIRKWLDCQVHVKGRPDWLFIKLHAHGAVERDFDAMFGDTAFKMHQILNEEYNDGRRYQLHYVTAREAYNIAKAAEAGMSGDPSAFADFRLGPPANKFYSADASHTLKSCTAKHLDIDNFHSNTLVKVQCNVGPVREISGPLSSVDINTETGTIHIEVSGLYGEVTLRMKDGGLISKIEGGVVAGVSGSALKLAIPQGANINYHYAASGAPNKNLFDPLSIKSEG